MLDVAGQAVMDALRLHEGAETEFDDAEGRMSLAEFSTWVNQALEAAKYMPVHPGQAQVVILPLSQLLGRSLQAVVLPGCDEVHLPVSPEPVGQWTPAQRELLSLPSREAETAAQRAAWQHALRFPHLDVLWRESQNGERLMPSGFVQEIVLQHAPALAPIRVCCGHWTSVHAAPHANRRGAAGPAPVGQRVRRLAALPVSLFCPAPIEGARGRRAGH